MFWTFVQIFLRPSTPYTHQSVSVLLILPSTSPCTAIPGRGSDIAFSFRFSSSGVDGGAWLGDGGWGQLGPEEG